MISNNIDLLINDVIVLVQYVLVVRNIFQEVSGWRTTKTSEEQYARK